jgi:hypothetical protein
VPCHHRLDEYLHEYIARTGIGTSPEGFLVRSAASNRGCTLSDRPPAQPDVHAMIRRRAKTTQFETRRIG